MKIFTSAHTVQKKRLLSAIESLEYETKHLDAKVYASNIPDIETALEKAKNSAKKCDFNMAWNQFNIAEQFMVRSLNQDQLDIKGAMLQKEASKIIGWRRQQIDFLLGPSDMPPIKPIMLDQLLTAMKVKDDFYNTRNHKMALHKANVNALTLIICTILIAILLLAIIFDYIICMNLFYQMIIAGMFGALGAGFSIANSFFSFSLETKIPEQLLGITVTTIRFVIGATSALILFFLYKSGFFNNLFSESILNSNYAYIVFSFAAGFSERWVIKMLELVVKDK